MGDLLCNKMSTFRCMQALQAVRQFSSSAVRPKLVQPPIQVFGTEGRYATALYSAASKQKKLNNVEKELSALQAELKKDSKLVEYLTDPSQSRTEKRVAVEKLMKQKKMSELTSNLFAALAENGRINKTMGVLSAFDKIMSAHRGEVQATVVTAKPLSDADMKELKSTLNGFLKKGESLLLSSEVDPSLIGGMKITIGDKFVDMSMATKIKTYTALMKQAV